MSARAKTHDTGAEPVLGVLRTLVGVALLTHFVLLLTHGFAYLRLGGLPHTQWALYTVAAVEFLVGIALASDFLFRLACALAILVLLVVMAVVVIAEKLGASDRMRQYPITLFLICLTGIFTGIGEFGLLVGLRENASRTAAPVITS